MCHPRNNEFAVILERIEGDRKLVRSEKKRRTALGARKEHKKVGKTGNGDERQHCRNSLEAKEQNTRGKRTQETEKQE